MEAYLTPAQVSELTGGAVTVNNLALRRYRKEQPAWVQPTPRVILYKRSVVEKWLQESEQGAGTPRRGKEKAGTAIPA